MNISVKSDYALRAVFDLALHSLSMPPGAPTNPVKIADIAKRQQIPQKFLELILASLKHRGFLDSRRGAEGGYLLARGPDAITVGEVLRAVENVKGAERGRKEEPFSQIWKRVERGVSAVLDQTSFGELARDWRARRSRYVPNWEI
jgi:Rrf2 family cysteine metabolism transcriptional repressor